MGVKTKISLGELNRLFPSYSFVKIEPTISGIIDTTYIVSNSANSYILKRYERDIREKVAMNIALLLELKSNGLNVPTRRDEKDGWYIYEKLKGSQPLHVKSYHIQALGRFLSKMHRVTSKMKCTNSIVEDELTEALRFTKSNYFAYYKHLELLKNFSDSSDGIIHGDIFKDNTIFDAQKVGVIDFIDSSCGTFAYDVAVCLVGFDVKVSNDYYINLFLKNYNQHAPKKLDKKTILMKMKFASHFFALKRVYEYKNTKRAKELISFC